ncbi:MAG: glycosyltransferase [Chlamydiota bacterium]
MLQEDLRKIQNKTGIHLCPSEVEGFGHCIFEALSTGAVVITTDAPPMNEFIKDPRCLVPFSHSAPTHLVNFLFC